MADYPNYITTPVTVEVSGTNWTVDVTPLNLDDDLSIKDFAAFNTYNGDRYENSLFNKTSSTVVVYVGPELEANTEIVILRETALSRLQFIAYASQFRSTVYNAETDNIYTLLAELVGFYSWLTENYIRNPTPMWFSLEPDPLDPLETIFVENELGTWLAWDLDGDGERDLEPIPVNLKGDTGEGVTAKGTVETAAMLPVPSADNAGHMYIAADTGIAYISDGQQWVSLGRIQGKSAYEVWKESNPAGTLTEFFESIKGPPGQGLDVSDVYLDAGDLPTDAPAGTLAITTGNGHVHISNGDGTWTDLGNLFYTPWPLWFGTQLGWDLDGDGASDTNYVDLKGDKGDGLEVTGVSDTVALLPSGEPEGTIYYVAETNTFYVSNGDGTWTEMGDLLIYVPRPVWQNTRLAWDLNDDGVADTNYVDLRGPRGEGISIQGVAGDSTTLPNDAPEGAMFVALDTGNVWVSNGDGTWTDLGQLFYTPQPVWNDTSLGWDLDGDGASDVAPVNLKGDSGVLIANVVATVADLPPTAVDGTIYFVIEDDSAYEYSTATSTWSSLGKIIVVPKAIWQGTQLAWDYNESGTPDTPFVDLKGDKGDGADIQLIDNGDGTFAIDTNNDGVPDTNSINVSELSGISNSTVVQEFLSSSSLDDMRRVLRLPVVQRHEFFLDAGTYTFTVPVLYVKDSLKVECIGGGGGGGGGSVNSGYAGGGGGGGGVSRKIIVGALPGDTFTVTVGAGGSWASEAYTGFSGGSSSFGSECSATGGIGGSWASHGGEGGTGVGGDFNSRLGNGGNGCPISTASPLSAGGHGGGPGGRGGRGDGQTSASPTGPGGGGGGAGVRTSDSGGYRGGSSGRQGAVLCTWWEYLPKYGVTDSDASSFVERLTEDYSVAEIAAVEDFFAALKSADLWNKLSVLQVYSWTDNVADAFLDFKNTTDGTNVGTAFNPIHAGWSTANGDYYINTNFVPSNFPAISKDNASLLIGLAATGSVQANEVDAGGVGGSGFRTYVEMKGGSLSHFGINELSDLGTNNYLDSYYDVMLSRRSLNSLEVFNNGSLFASGSQTSYNPTNTFIFVGAYNDSGTAMQFTDSRTYTYFAMGVGLSGAEHASFVTTINNFESALVAARS